jgi:hypothetical protein
MATAEIGHDGGGITRTRLLRWVGLAILIGIGLILVSRLSDALLRQPAYTSSETAQAGIAPGHCAHFITVAKVAYGVDWKYRLDPRDTTCAAEVKQQWQYEWNARQPMQPLPSATMTINQPSQPVVDPGPAASDYSRIRNPETYCLNVISLARSRYGSDWANRVTPEEAANCGNAIRVSAGR